MYFCAGQEEEGKGRTKPRIIRRWLDGKPGLCGDVTTSNDATWVCWCAFLGPTTATGANGALKANQKGFWKEEKSRFMLCDRC